MTLNSSVVVPSNTLNSSGASKELYSVSKLQFVLPQFIFFQFNSTSLSQASAPLSKLHYGSVIVWSCPTCCVASLRAVPVGCISYKSVYCVTFGHLQKGTNQIYDDDDDDGSHEAPNSQTACLCLHGQAPDYRTRSWITVSTVCSRSRLRTATVGQLLAPSIHTGTFGSRGVSFSCTTAWNALPNYLRQMQHVSIFTFKNHLKTS